VQIDGIKPNAKFIIVSVVNNSECSGYLSTHTGYRE